MDIVENPWKGAHKIKEEATQENQPNFKDYTNSSTYRAYSRMKSRCCNPKFREFKSFGQKGVMVHPDWMRFQQFFEDMGPMPKNCNMIVRIDETKDFMKGNCEYGKVKRKPREKVTTTPVVRFCVCLPKKLLEEIRDHVVQLSLARRKQVTVADLIREQLQSCLEEE